MKKIISIVLAVMMMFAVMIPAFAAENDVILDGKPSDATAANEVIVKTLTTDDKGESAEKYTVTIPAETTIPWGKTTAVTLTYKVSTTLLYTNKLAITVAGTASANAGFNKMTSANTGATLDYKLAGATAQDVPAYADKAPYDLTVTVSNWNVAIDAYQDNLTFTSAIVAA